MMDGFYGKDVHGFLFHIWAEGIPEILILLNSQGNVNIVSNGYLLINIREVVWCIKFYRNSRVSCNNLIRYLVGYPETILYDTKAISNILSMVLVDKPPQITNKDDKLFIMHKDGRDKRRLTRPEQGMY